VKNNEKIEAISVNTGKKHQIEDFGGAFNSERRALTPCRRSTEIRRVYPLFRPENGGKTASFELSLSC